MKIKNIVREKECPTLNMDTPSVLVALLVKNKEYCLKEYLSCILSQNYPKNRMHLYIRANNCRDNSIELLKEWEKKHGNEYMGITSDYSDIKEDKVNEKKGEHEWDSLRFAVLGKIRQDSMLKTLELKLDFYFVIDADNFLTPNALQRLVKLDLKYVGPFLRITKLSETHSLYANIHHCADNRGYYLDSPVYKHILDGTVKGVIECAVVHTCYLIRADAILKLHYVRKDDERHEYVLFSESARHAGIKQYIDNRDFYGWLIFDELEMPAVRGDFRLKTKL